MHTPAVSEALYTVTVDPTDLPVQGHYVMRDEARYAGPFHHPVDARRTLALALEAGADPNTFRLVYARGTWCSEAIGGLDGAL